MKKYYLSVILLLLFCTINAQPVFINLGNTTVETTTLFTSEHTPWELKTGPADSLWMTTKAGLVYRISAETGDAHLLLDISLRISQINGEVGMYGMTFHPDFANNPYVYIAWVDASSGTLIEKLSRFTYINNQLSPASEFVLIDSIPCGLTHFGSRLVILPDNTILMTTGDSGDTSLAQNNSSLNGKVLRVNLDGSIPANNPIPGSRIFTLGHRNPQGLMLHPNGKVYSTEHGPEYDDEFQIIEAGRNYGWPYVWGYCDNDIPDETAVCSVLNVKEPLASWNPAPGTTWAPNDLIWYSSNKIPEFENSILVTFLKTQKIRRIYLNSAGDSVVAEQDFFVNQWGRLRDITTDSEGTIYLATNTPPFRIIKIKPLAVVPVVVSSLSSFCNNKNPRISWNTSMENNVNRFIVYKSFNDIEYSVAGVLAPKGNRGASLVNYTFIDSMYTGARTYYKLVSEDINGTRKEWGRVVSNCENTDVSFSIIPNPAKEVCRLKIDNAREPVYIAVYDMLGKVVYQSKASSSVELRLSKWAAGIYNVVIKDENNNLLFSKKLVVN